MNRLGAMTAPLAERRFRLLFGAQAISVLGDTLVPVALAFAVLDVTGSASALGLVLLARVLPMVLFFLAGGVLGDRLPRGAVMISSNLANLVLQTLLGLLFVTGEARLWEIVVLSALKGTATAFFRPAAGSVVPDTVSPERLQQANGLLQLTLNAASIAGPAIAGVLVATVGAGWAILGDAASFGIASLLLARIGSLGRAPRTGERESFLRELAEGWQHVRSRTWLWVLISSFAAYQLVVIASMSVLGPLVAKRSLGGAGAWALITAALGVGSILGGIVTLRLRPRRPLLLCYLLMLVAGAPSLALLAIPAPALLVALAEVGTGFAIGIFGPIEFTLLQEKIPPEARSRVLAYDWMGSTALRPIGLAVIGPIADATGLRATLAGAAVLALGCALWPLAYRSVRELESGPEADAVLVPVV